MDLSVIIVCYKGYERLNSCLELLASFSQAGFSMEVIVVNNNPGDELLKETERKFPRFRFIHNTVNGGYSNGCNLGCSAAAGDHFLILNPDTVASEQAVSRLLAAARSNPAYHILSCRQMSESGRESRAYGKFPWTGSAGKDDHGSDVLFPDWVSGSLMMMRSDIFRKLKGFDEEFWMYYEDVDICRRVRNEGGEVAFINNISIEHNHGASSRTDLKTAALSKCEVQISRHLYIHKHEKGLRRNAIQAIIAADNLITGIIAGIAGLILFFVPKLLVRTMLLIRLIDYYTGALRRRSWRSPRSVIAAG